MTSVAWAVAVVLDLHTGVYGTIAYVCVAEAMALMGVLLTTRIPQHRISRVIAIRRALVGNLRSRECTRGRSAGRGPWLAASGSRGGLVRRLGVAALPRPVPVRAARADAGRRLASRRWWPAPASVAILLEIADDGHGMNERRIGVGMQTMRERATELGGTCQITSTPGARASVAARLPALASGVEAG
jgi:hypothetical protein